MRATTRLRELLRSGKIVSAPGAHDAITAMIIEREGFPAIYLTGGGTTNAGFGRPDVGLTTRTERVEQARAIVSAIDIPVICDVDDGFGTPVGVMQTVREFEAAGVAGIHIEDQRHPRRCGYMSGGDLLPIDEMVGKLRAALDARRDPDLLIIARVEALMTSSFEETVERGRAYGAAGADMLFINGLTSMEQIERTARAFTTPQLFNVSTSGQTPLVPIDQLQALGFKIAIYPAFALCAAVKTIIELMRELKSTGTVAGFQDRMLTFPQLNEILQLDSYRQADARYTPA